MSFWAVEVVPGKTISALPPYDLHLTQVVLPASAKDKGRSVVEAKVEDKAFALAALKLDLQENISLDLIFEAQKTVNFSVTGNNPVQLLGYFIDNSQSDDFSDDEGAFPFGEDDEEEIDSDDFDEEGDEDDSDDVDEDELTGATLQALTNQIQAQKRKGDQPQGNGAKKAKVEQPQQQQKPQQQQQQKGQQQQQKGQQQKGEQQQKPQQQQQKGQQQKGEQQQKQQQQKPQTPEGSTKMVQGVKIETNTIGLGATANPGKKVHVMYTGRLENGKVFDKSDRPFGFVLGAGQVIGGWDIGVNGMRVGEKRRLTIPPNLAYGKSGSPPEIPRNATLIFDVELIRV